MQENLMSIEVDCECGKTHALSSLILEHNGANKLFDYIEEQGYSKVRVFVGDEYKSVKEYNDFVKILSYKLNIEVDTLKIGYAEERIANLLEYKGEDYVIVFGDYKLIEIVKYYAKSIGLKLSVCVCGEFWDFTFSKYSRLYDGISYCFYQTIGPEYVIYFDNLLTHNILNLKSYFKLKSLSYFENTLASRTETEICCSKINSKILKATKYASKIKNIDNALYLCIFLGRAMSFFNGTKYFFGAEMEVCSILEVKTKRSFFECYLIAGELIIEVYRSALSSGLKILNFNLNKRIDRIKKIMGLSAIKCLGFVKKQSDIERLKKQARLILALRYMLSDLLEGKEQNISCSISSRCLLEALYVSPEFSSRYLFLNLIRDLGYLENLIK